MSRMSLEKDDFRRSSVIWEFRVTGNWVAARVASRVKMGLSVVIINPKIASFLSLQFTYMIFIYLQSYTKTPFAMILRVFARGRINTMVTLK